MTTEQLLSLLHALGVGAVVATIYHLTPGWSRRELYFAVTVDPAFRDRPLARAILSRYRIEVWCHAAFGGLLALAGWWRNVPGLLTAGVLWQAFGPIRAFFVARKRVLPYAAAPSTVREADLSARPLKLPGGLVGQLGPFAVLSAVAGYLHLHWAELPARFPVHYGWHGADQWAARSPGAVYGLLVVGAALSGMMLLLAYGIVHGARPGNDRFRATNLVVLLAVEYFLVAVFTAIALIPLVGGVQLLVPVLVPVELALVILIPFALARRNRGPRVDQAPDSSWRWGMFYVDKDDPALFVEKRFGLGYTLNMGNRWSWLVVAATLLVPLASVLLLAR